jgi:quercetin dioxygenase-like cupin family protein
MTEQNDPNFQSSTNFAGLAINVEDSPAGPIEVIGFDHRGSLASRLGIDRLPTAKLRLRDGGSGVVLPIAPVKVHCYAGTTAQLVDGCFAVVPGGSYIFEGAGIVIYTPNYKGLTQFGGPIEARGRLKYIDGCSDSLLVCPALYGEACLNHLHIPPDINQSQHVHPSDRIGIIIRGEGECRTPVATHKLKPGMFWRIPTGGVHSFHTGPHSSLEVFAWHPDSEFGPRHEDHPMLTRTIVDGAPASDPRHAGIRTKEIVS